MSFNFPPKKGKEQISCWKFTYKVPHSGDIIRRHAIVFSVCIFRSPTKATERAGVFGAGVGPVGDPLVLQVQHFCGTGPVCGAAPLELWHPPQRGRCHRLGDCGSGRSRQGTPKPRGRSVLPHQMLLVLFPHTFGIRFAEKSRLHMSQRATCCSCESVALR